MKKMKMKMILVVATIATTGLLSQGAQAADINRTFALGLTNPGTTYFGDIFDTPTSGKTFSDQFTFTISSANLDAVVASISTNTAFDLDITGFSLINTATSAVVASGTQLSTGTLDTWTLAGVTVGAGSYALVVDGKVLGAYGGSFGGNVNAVPEPETYAMLLAGLGVMGAIGRRKTKSSEDRS